MLKRIGQFVFIGALLAWGIILFLQERDEGMSTEELRFKMTPRKTEGQILFKSAASEMSGTIENSREFHAWVGFGRMHVSEYIRAFETPTGWDGEFYVWWSMTSSSKVSTSRCLSRKKIPPFELCKIVSKGDPRLKMLLNELATEGILELPDPLELDVRERLYADGVGIAVHLNDGEIQRSFGYSNPGLQNFSEAKKAERYLRAITDFRQDSVGTMILQKH